MKNPPFFGVHMRPDGSPLDDMPYGKLPDRLNGRTWAHITAGMPAPDPNLYGPADVPLPPERVSPSPTAAAPYHPGDEDRATRSRGQVTEAPPLARATVSGPVPVSIVSAPSIFHDVTTTSEHPGTRVFPAGVHPDFTLGNNSGGFGSPGFGSDDHFDRWPGHHAPHFESVEAHPVEPHVDDSALLTLDQKIQDAQGHLKELGATSVAPQISMAALDAFIAKAMQAKQLMSELGSSSGRGGTSGSLGPSYPAAAPTGRMGGPR